MSNLKKALGCSLVFLSMSMVCAYADPLAERQQILENMGKATKPVVPMLRGQSPFNLQTVQAALKNYADSARTLPTLFPEGSDKGKTEASPKIWQNKDKFDGLWKQLGSDATVVSAAITDEATFKANFPKVLNDCKTCHDDFRIEK